MGPRRWSGSAGRALEWRVAGTTRHGHGVAEWIRHDWRRSGGGRCHFEGAWCRHGLRQHGCRCCQWHHGPAKIHHAVHGHENGGASSDASGRTMMECMGRVFHAWVRGVCPAAAAVAGVVLWGMLECRWHPPWPSAASPLPAPALLVRMSRRSLCRLDEMMGWWGLCLHSQ